MYPHRDTRPHAQSAPTHTFLPSPLLFLCVMCCSNAFSGQKLFTEGSIQLYNVLFTTAPLLLFGMWDRDVTYEHALKVHEYDRPSNNTHVH